MRNHLWPLGLAALLLNPVPALADTGSRDAMAASTTASVLEEPSGPLDLQAAIRLALGSNPEISAAGNELGAQEAAILQAQARPNPEISALIEDTRSSTRSTTIQVDQPIELGGKRQARVQVAERSRDVATAELAAKCAELRAAVTSAFFDVLAAQEKLRLAQASADLASRASSAATRRVTAGKVSPVEATKAQVAEAGVRVELAGARSELSVARKRLAGLWGNALPRFERAEGNLEVLPALPALAELNARLAAAPNLQRAKVEIERRRAQAEVERSRQTPDVTLSVGARRNEELGLNQAILGLSVPIPVFNRNQGNLLEALRRTDKANDEYSALLQRLSQELAVAHEQSSFAREEAEAIQKDILPGAQTALDAATRGFELGKFNFLDVLDAQRTLFQAKAQYLRALAAAYRSAAEIERVIGVALSDTTTASTPE